MNEEQKLITIQKKINKHNFILFIINNKGKKRVNRDYFNLLLTNKSSIFIKILIVYFYFFFYKFNHRSCFSFFLKI